MTVWCLFRGCDNYGELVRVYYEEADAINELKSLPDHYFVEPFDLIGY